MATASRIVPNSYRDSVALMQASAVLRGMPGVGEASMVMATESNLALLREVKLIEEPMEPRPNDVLLVVQARSAAQAQAALDHGVALLGQSAAKAVSREKEQLAPRSLDMALAERSANLALISVPGDYAAAEAEKALRRGLNVMLFSDNVALADEVRLKKLAAEKGLMLMGPDCGTAIIDGVPLGFANVVRRGSIGCVAASGTGLQQVTTLIDRAGLGISQAIGTGGRDLSAQVGGATMLAGLKALAADRDTKVIVLISKPPAESVAGKVLAQAAKAGKPVVAAFIGAKLEKHKGIHPAGTLEEAAQLAVSLAGGKFKRSAVKASRAVRPGKGQRKIAGLFSGGTFAYEAEMILGAGHSIIDFGDDAYTRGRPHPMIDFRLRNEQIVRAAADREVGVILLDVVLGHGAHPDPAAELAPAIQAARKRNRKLAIVASVCGTAADPQSLAKQEAALREEGVILAPSNAAAARLARSLVGK
jgi:succinyl-CoA synthetase alpha subunit